MSEPIYTVKFMKLNPEAITPSLRSVAASGFDLAACLSGYGKFFLGPHETKLVPTGIAVEIPVGLEGQVRLRSSLGKQGIMLANGVGTVDQDYRGELFVALHNGNDSGMKTIEHGDRIAQIVFTPLPPLILEEVSELTPTERGSGGFGSTGK